MKVADFVSKYFGIVLVIAVLTGLVLPNKFDFLRIPNRSKTAVQGNESGSGISGSLAACPVPYSLLFHYKIGGFK